MIVDERPHGIFTRQLFLGDNLDANNLSADYDRGVLMLTIPIAEKSKPRRIQLGAREQEELPDNGAATRVVEQVTGRLNYGGAALKGATSGTVPGALIGWIFGLFNLINPLVASAVLATPITG